MTTRCLSLKGCSARLCMQGGSIFSLVLTSIEQPCWVMESEAIEREDCSSRSDAGRVRGDLCALEYVVRSSYGIANAAGQ